MTELKTWVRENSTLVYFLIAQAIALTSGAAWGLQYMTRLESRVDTLETRGSPHLGTIDNRLTVLESLTRSNKESIDRVVNALTQDVGKKP
jgi:hypothetical protein